MRTSRWNMEITVVRQDEFTKGVVFQTGQPANKQKHKKKKIKACIHGDLLPNQ